MTIDDILSTGEKITATKTLRAAKISDAYENPRKRAVDALRDIVQLIEAPRRQPLVVSVCYWQCGTCIKCIAEKGLEDQ